VYAFRKRTIIQPTSARREVVGNDQFEYEIGGFCGRERDLRGRELSCRGVSIVRGE